MANGSEVNWPGLLAWSTKYHDGTAPSEFKKMSAEDKAFLEKAMEDAFSQIEDYNKVLDDGLRKLEKAEDVQTKIVACEIIDRCIDDPDCARNLEVFNGIAPLLKNATLVESDDVSNRCCTMLSMMIANNEKMQLAAVQKHNALDILLKQLGVEHLRTSKKRMKLLADIVRGVPELEETFCKEYRGIEFLCSMLISPSITSSNAVSNNEEVPAVKERVVTFLRHLLASDPKTRILQNANGGHQEGVELDSETLIGTALMQIYSNVEELERSNMQYTENCAQLTLVACSESRNIHARVQPVVKTRMEALLRQQVLENAGDHQDVSVEIEELKAILRLHQQSQKL